MNKYEKELLDIINKTFKDEITQNEVIIEVSTPELAEQEGYNYKGWKVGIRKTKEGLRDVRLVIDGLDLDIMREANNYQQILNSIADMAKEILYKPPHEQHITQGLIQVTSNNIEFIPKDILRKEA